MTTLELFVNTIILSVAVGIILGGVGMNVLVVRPLQRRHTREHQRVLNAFRQGVGQHLGTPNLRPAELDHGRGDLSWMRPIPADALTDLADNDRWSRKAPELVSLPATRVQTGRPA